MTFFVSCQVSFAYIKMNISMQFYISLSYYVLMFFPTALNVEFPIIPWPLIICLRWTLSFLSTFYFYFHIQLCICFLVFAAFLWYSLKSRLLTFLMQRCCVFFTYISDFSLAFGIFLIISNSRCIQTFNLVISLSAYCSITYYH